MLKTRIFFQGVTSVQHENGDEVKELSFMEGLTILKVEDDGSDSVVLTLASPTSKSKERK
jgi:hypothetical protein